MADAGLTFEDFALGTRFSLGPYPVTREAVIDFARAYDPQPFHLDEEAAKATLLGGLSASGWHSCAMMMRMMVDSFLARSTSQGACQVEHVSWLAPVRPGDVLSGLARVEGARLSASRPGIGLATIAIELANQRGEKVLDGRYLQFLLARGAFPRPVSARAIAPEEARVRPREHTSPAHPNAARFFDLFEEGDVDDLGSHRFEASEIIAFARDFDPQYFHLDAERARHSMLGGLCASGWHVAAAMMRLLVEANARLAKDWIAGAKGAPPRFGPSPGVRDLRWLQPVRPGDTLRYERVVKARRMSRSRPGWGVVEMGVLARNQAGALAFTMDAAAFVGTQ